MKNLEIRAALGRPEFIEVEKNVRLHISDLGEGSPVVLIHGWPLSDAMYEYQYAALIENGFRAIGITLRGFGQSDKPYGKSSLRTSQGAAAPKRANLLMCSLLYFEAKRIIVAPPKEKPPRTALSIRSSSRTTLISSAKTS